MTKCCIHCRLNDIGAPPDDLIVEWPGKHPMPRWLIAASDTWVTREGQVIPIMQLGDRHLYNIYRMLLRIQADIDSVDEEGHPRGGNPSLELFDTKFSAIIAEMERRQMPTILKEKIDHWEEGYPHAVD
ncbi:hypothetical protein LCGC14_1663490 [marine sediment metagenome]|uniref:Uncharacterized protein n=1 Tax=marine sediment metagenome TaxID=412755 RepID=A0A0F9K992_9ZZZZ